MILCSVYYCTLTLYHLSFPLWPGCCLLHKARKLSAHISTSSSNESGVWDQNSDVLESTSKSHEDVVQILIVFTHSTLSSFSQLTSVDSWIVRSVEWRKLKQYYKWLYMLCRYHLKVESCKTTVHFWDIPEEMKWREILSVGKKFQPVCLIVYFASKKKWLKVWVYIYSWAMTNGIVGWSGVRRNTMRKFVTRKSRGKYMVRLHIMGKKVWKYSCPMWKFTKGWG